MNKERKSILLDGEDHDLLKEYSEKSGISIRKLVKEGIRYVVSGEVKVSPVVTGSKEEKLAALRGMMNNPVVPEVQVESQRDRAIREERERKEIGDSEYVVDRQ